MKTTDKCICLNESVSYGLCNECIMLLKAKRCKNISVIENMRKEYNEKHNQYKTYGQFVAMIEEISRRKKDFDNRRKKASIKKVRANR